MNRKYKRKKVPYFWSTITTMENGRINCSCGGFDLFEIKNNKKVINIKNEIRQRLVDEYGYDYENIIFTCFNKL